MASHAHSYKKEADFVDSAIEEPTRSMRGMGFLFQALRGEDFPMDWEGINYSVGDIEVEDGKGGYIPVRQLTDLLPRPEGNRPGVEFNSPEEVVDALNSLIK